jgi:beta-lactamase superfamily II metal-dependent hydrolase
MILDQQRICQPMVGNGCGLFGENMEVFFLDVGQGTSQVILLGGKQAIVLDCGLPNDRFVLQFLLKMGVECIPRLIVSHSHKDHIGGAVSILGEYQDRIEKICFVQDDLFLASAFWLRISEFLKSGILTKDQLCRLESTDQPQLVWSESSTSAKLRTFSPSAAENLDAQGSGKQNPTSAVLFLDVKKHRIIFSADSEVTQWQEIRRKYGQRYPCNILAMPHHAGEINGTKEQIQWLFNEAINPRVVIVSVGTNNTHGHPRANVIQTISALGIKVICTQITKQCCDNLESLRPGVLQPLTHFSRSSPTQDVNSRGNSRNVACAGSVRAIVSDEEIVVDRLDEHQRAVDTLANLKQGHPLCRNSV